MRGLRHAKRGTISAMHARVSGAALSKFGTARKNRRSIASPSQIDEGQTNGSLPHRPGSKDTLLVSTLISQDSPGWMGRPPPLCAIPPRKTRARRRERSVSCSVGLSQSSEQLREAHKVSRSDCLPRRRLLVGQEQIFAMFLLQRWMDLGVKPTSEIRASHF